MAMKWHDLLLGAQLGRGQPRGDQHLRRHTATVSDQPQQDVFGPDVVVTQLQRLP
jgi:hypothetical protein